MGEKEAEIYVCHICRMVGPLTPAMVKAHEIVHGHRPELVSDEDLEEAASPALGAVEAPE